MSQPAGTGAGPTGRLRAALRLDAFPLAVYAATTLFSVVAIAVLAGREIPATLVGPNSGLAATNPDLSGFWQVATNWDGQWYRLIAEHGYPARLPLANGAVEHNAWAYYPLYPMISRAVTAVTGVAFSYVAPVLSTIFGAGAVVVLHRLFRATSSPLVARSGVVTLCVWLTAPVMHLAYTESLALLLLGLWFLALHRHRYWTVVAVGLLIGLTRPIAAPLLVVLVLHLVRRWRAERRGQERLARLPALAALGGGVLAVGLWPLVAAVATGRLDAYPATVGAWVDPARPPLGLFGAVLVGHDLLIAVLLLAVAGVVAFGLVKARGRAWGPDLIAWSAVYLTFVLAVRSFDTSLARYAFLAIVPFWPFADADETMSRREHRIVLAVLVVLGLAAQVVWVGQAVVISTTGTVSWP